MSSVGDILAYKGTEVFSSRVGDTVVVAAKQMAERKIGAVLIFDGDRVAGILSERDCTRGVLAVEKSALSVKVEEVMTADVHSVRMDTTVEQCMALMSKEAIRHLPVLEQDQVVGMISVSDIVSAVIRDQAARIESLETEVMITNSNLRAFL